MHKLCLDIDETEFKQQLFAMLNCGGTSLQNAVMTVVKTCIAQQLERLIVAGSCLQYEFKNGGQSRIESLKQAIECGGFDFWYLDVQVDLHPGTVLSEQDVAQPSAMQWLPINYGGGVRRTFQFKRITMNTRERYVIKILHPLVPVPIIKAVLDQFKGECPCNSQHLVPTHAGAWEWQQTFGCLLCGKQYFCDCFRTAIAKFNESEEQQCCDDGDLDQEQYLTDDKSPIGYREGICHLCTGTPSTLIYCHPMYGSAIKVRYGAYIEKFAIAENLSSRDAENKVRDILDVPRIGEGWISETQLFNLARVFFSGYEVVREAHTDWLGNQRLDIFVPALSVAIEYQGEQHFQPVKRFGGEAGFREGQLRDRRKRQLCKENGVKLVYFTHKEELSVERVERRLKPFLPASKSKP
jgi:hypothetical protein